MGSSKSLFHNTPLSPFLLQKTSCLQVAKSLRTTGATIPSKMKRDKMLLGSILLLLFAIALTLAEDYKLYCDGVPLSFRGQPISNFQGFGWSFSGVIFALYCFHLYFKGDR